jgi:murein DD-endopeptidase MepM/ murein hydrolase activator NlpD
MEQIKQAINDFRIFFREFYKFYYNLIHFHFSVFESRKDFFVTALYRQRGKLAGRFIHSGMAGLTAVGVMIAPVVAQELPGVGGATVNPWDIMSPSSVLSASTQNPAVATSISDKGRTEIVQYTVESGDTVSSIAQKFGITSDTIIWQNNLTSKDAIKEGQTLEILPIDGVAHKVSKGDTIYSIGKKYGLDESEVQAVTEFPFNTFVNDETFELAVGQIVIVPNGVKPDPQIPSGATRPRQLTPNAGTVVASGSFVWPTQGTISQRFAWYHPAIDIANRAAPNILAADAGKVITSGWSSVGYGNHVIIDHGNGYKTLYAHMQRLFVVEGQTVTRGSAIGQMGSTGRSTGTHLHFEVILNGARLNPLGVLR